ncbi:MAG: winged helix-turn-helix transcriptional regulator [Bryobacteraceae bacterium]
MQTASKIDNVSVVSEAESEKRRSGCPVSVSLEVFGDRWSLLVVRDLMVRGHRTFKEFAESGEGIATNILADRLKKLQTAGIIVASQELTDYRRVHYELTEKGISLAPVLLELLIWAAHHEETGAPCAVIEHMERNREQVLAEVRRRWAEKDRTPILPRFEGQKTKRKGVRVDEQGSGTGRDAKRGIRLVGRRKA